MEKSEAINELISAISKMQSDIKGATKNSENPFFKSEYADLAAVWDAIRDPLTKNNLAIIQTTAPMDHGVMIETMIGHSSGQWILGKLQMNPVKNDPQAYGSAISYGRRYALAAIAGVYQIDDDANHATQRADSQSQPLERPVAEPKTQPQKDTSRYQTPPPQRQGTANERVYTPNPAVKVSINQLKRMFAICSPAGWDPDQLRNAGKDIYGTKSLRDLNQVQYDELCNRLSQINPKDFFNQLKPTIAEDGLPF